MAANSTSDAATATATAAKPTFSPDAATVVFVLGGPGAGKGTQCARLVEHYSFTHLSAGDLLRAEQEREGSEFGELIKEYIREGKIVPLQVTVKLLENAMKAAIASGEQPDVEAAAAAGPAKKKARFLIDGFPRKADQAEAFENTVCPARLVLFYDCPEDELERRLLDRGKTSGRADDNIESIKKRFRTFVETSLPVIQHYEKEGKVVKVVATKPIEEVFADTVAKLDSRLEE